MNNARANGLLAGCIAVVTLLTFSGSAHGAEPSGNVPPPRLVSPPGARKVSAGVALISTGALLGAVAIPMGIVMRGNAADDLRYAQEGWATTSATRRRRGGTSLLVVGAVGSAALVAGGVTLLALGLRERRGGGESTSVRVLPSYQRGAGGFTVVGRF